MRIRKRIITAAIMLLSCSCGLIDLSSFEAEAQPSAPDEILAAGECVSISFPGPVDRIRAESLFRLEGPDGILEGDFEWENFRFSFIPYEALIPGYRYRILFQGELKTADGRVFAQHINTPFYYITDALPPLLTQHSPAYAGEVGVLQPLTLCFSKPIDRESFSAGFSLNPGTEYRTEWNTDGTTAVITPEKRWLNLTYYRWRISEETADLRGIRLPESEEGSFLVQDGTEPPEVISVHPAGENPDGSFAVHSGLSPDDLQIGEHLAFEFSEAVGLTSLNRCFSISPAVNGYLLALTPETFIYYINEDLPPEGEYTVTIEAGLEDLCGICTAVDWSIKVRPDIRAQTVTAVEIVDSNGSFITVIPEEFNKGGFIDTALLDFFEENSLHLVISLSERFPSDTPPDAGFSARSAFEETISLSAAFPPGTPVPFLFSTNWETDRRLRLIYEGLRLSEPGRPVYYRFSAAAGGPDSAAEGGSYLTDGIEFSFISGQQ